METTQAKPAPAPISEQIDTIMDNMDFGQVQRVVEALGWRWSMSDGLRIPTEGEIRKAARELLRQSAKENWSRVETQGFRVSFENGWLTLSFEVAGWDAYDSLADD